MEFPSTLLRLVKLSGIFPSDMRNQLNSIWVHQFWENICNIGHHEGSGILFSECLVLIKADDGWFWALFMGDKNFVDGPTSKYPILQKKEKKNQHGMGTSVTVRTGWRDTKEPSGSWT
eukprot:TRINITY_DN10780_c0_g1_i4.p1 TRINITY_DN10780_c0_g1~~TRINITY_DN10780_c0_g1_i4.p1  ORF type:complete len:118 (-),score=11.49 TRINITY_DN10780_c0_g1_i4:1408-1761(-)